MGNDPLCSANAWLCLRFDPHLARLFASGLRWIFSKAISEVERIASEIIAHVSHVSRYFVPTYHR